MDLYFPFSPGREVWNSTIVPAWTVVQETSGSGRNRSLCSQLYPKYTYNLTLPAITDAEKNKLLGFFSQCKGSHYPFWYKDFRNKVSKLPLPKKSDGTFQCVRGYDNFNEPVSKVDKLTVYVNGTKTTNFTQSNGVIRLGTTASAGSVTADYEFYDKVRFESSITITEIFFNVNKVSLKLTTVR